MPSSTNRAPSQGMELPPDLEPIYTNVARISHTPAEIVFDFARILPAQMMPARVFSRLIMSPMGAKLFYLALGENLARYESIFGKINTPGDSTLASDLFRSIHPPEKPEQP